MGFRNPFRIQVDSNGVAYVTDYSPDSRAPAYFRGPAGTGRVEIVRKPANYGWPMCYAPNLPMYLWDFNASTAFMEPFECDNREAGPANTSRWNTGLRHGPPIAQPDIWYSYNDNATRRRARRASRTTTGPAAPARSSSRSSGPAASARTARHVRVRPGQPERDQVPAVLRRGDVLR